MADFFRSSFINSMVTLGQLCSSLRNFFPSSNIERFGRIVVQYGPVLSRFAQGLTEQYQRNSQKYLFQPTVSIIMLSPGALMFGLSSSSGLDSNQHTADHSHTNVDSHINNSNKLPTEMLRTFISAKTLTKFYYLDKTLQKS